ncbi:hypothetical protein PsorP6_016312 [Peronosclerospora sorghi]|uniref:Uncharacterized protein n=1 Tax=Peronosclerospora sorghi TaxID=230839 RepID=A0ACC0VPH0_9STRA|nr:hypothetical protein PsorP6_016312 [Peronosclerospora sorghi]
MTYLIRYSPRKISWLQIVEWDPWPPCPSLSPFFWSRHAIQPSNVLSFHVLMAPTSAYSVNPVQPITTKASSNGLRVRNHIRSRHCCASSQPRARYKYPSLSSAMARRYESDDLAHEEETRRFLMHLVGDRVDVVQRFVGWESRMTDEPHNGLCLFV